MKNSESRVFTSENFWSPFQKDLESSTARIIIQSPFISSKRVNALIDVFRKLVEKETIICLFAQEPRFWNYDREEIDQQNAVRINEMQSFINLFEAERIHLNLRKNIHEKLAIIDDLILWEGSLNILSYNESKERMRRWTDPKEIKSAIKLHNLESCAHCKKLVDELKKRGNKNTDDSEYEVLVEQIVSYRKSLNIKQEAFAKKLGISQSKLSRLENGNRNISTSDLRKLTEALDLELIAVPKALLPSIANQIIRS